MGKAAGAINRKTRRPMRRRRRGLRAAAISVALISALGPVIPARAAGSITCVSITYRVLNGTWQTVFTGCVPPPPPQFPSYVQLQNCVGPPGVVQTCYVVRVYHPL